MRTCTVTEPYDVIAVGSGINSLVLAALLALKGRRVLILERETTPGGCMKTEEITVPGFRHDVFAMSVPGFVTAPHYPALAGALAAQGVRFLTAEHPTAVLTPTGRALILSRSRADNIAAFEGCAAGDGLAFARAVDTVADVAGVVGAMLNNPPHSPRALMALASLFRRGGAPALDAAAHEATEPLRVWLERDFASDLPPALIAPWILHAGMDPDAPTTAVMARLFMALLEQVGAPIVEGGIAALAAGLIRIVEAHGGALRCGEDVTRVVTRGRVVLGVETASGTSYRARRAVACDVTPQQLYGRLLCDAAVPDSVRRRADRFSYGRGDMQIHIALSEPPRWRAQALGGVALTHITAGVNGVARAVTEARAGLLPAEGTIVVGQPAATDPTRCPPGCSLLWIQLQEVPARPTGDASGIIPVDSAAGWSEQLKAAYAKRIVARLADAIPNLHEATLGTAVLSPADLEARNVNLVGGDPYSGDCALHQFHLLRSGAGGPRTALRNLYHIGASTHPGPSLAGMSGYMAAGLIG